MSNAAVISLTPVRDTIHALARRHNVVYLKTTTDVLADHYARLSDSETHLDETECLITALERNGILDRDQGLKLHSQYLDEVGEY